MEPPKPPSPPSAASAGSHVFLPALRDASRHSQRVSGRQRGAGFGSCPPPSPPFPPVPALGFSCHGWGPRFGFLFFFWRGKIRAVGCLPRVLLPPRSNADPTTSDPNAFPASPPAAPWPWVWGVGWGWFWPCCFFCASCLGFRWHTAAGGVQLGLWAFLGSSAPWGRLPSLVQDGSGVTTTPPWRGLGTTQAFPEQDSAVPRGEGTSSPSCLALPGLGAKQGLSSWDGAREEPAGAEPDPVWLFVLAWAAPKTSRLPCCWFWSSIPPCSASSTGCPRGQQSPAGLLLDGSDSLCLLKITCTYPLVPPYM